MSTLSTRNSLFLFSVILVAGVLLRFYHLDTYSIFFDEKSTMVVSQGVVLEGANQKDVFSKPSFTPADFWKPKIRADYYEAMTRSDIGNSPFYYLLLHGWMDIFGLSDYSARSMSAVASVLIILLTFVFARRFFTPEVALIAAAIVAVEPFFIAYGHQARNYSLTFLLTLASTLMLLQIVENENSGKRNYKDYFLYVAATFLCPLSHFLTVSVLLAQGIYVLFFLKISGWPRLAVAVAVSMTGIFWWLKFAGGQYTLYTLDYQAKEYRRVAETMPYNNPYGVVLPATVGNVTMKSLPIFSDLLIFMNGLADTLAGKKNLLLSVTSGVLIAVLYRLKGFGALQLPVRFGLLFLAAFGPMVFYSATRGQFVVLSVGIFLLSLFPDVHRRATNPEKRRLWLLYIMGMVPTLFLIVFAFKNGHTYGLTQRYSGFSFPYVIIFLAMLSVHVATIRQEFRWLVGVVMLMQAGFVGLRLKAFYEDRSPKYGYFATPRPANPYYEAAQKIKSMYQPGDTVFYGAPRIVPFNDMGKTFFSHSVQDAQLTNLYLPKTAAYIQVLDTVRVDQIILKKKEGNSIGLADLTDKRF